MSARRGGSGAGRRRALRALLALAAIFLLSAALTLPTTILLLPAWSWLERSAGIEAVGHSGPAEWCYALVFAVLAGLGALWLMSRAGAGPRGA